MAMAKPTRRQIFADGMNLATSLVLANGGVIVGQAPHMLFFRDTNGDNKADERTILFTGWPRNDTHGTISNMRWGFDNQIWGSVGYNGFRGTVGNVTYDRQTNPFFAGYFRFPTDISTLDYVARTSNNTWGFGFTEDGYMFGSTANSQPSAFVHIPGRYYRSLGMNLPPTLPRIHDRNDIYPVRDVLQVDQFGRYTAGAAHEIYTARSFPEEYWNKMAFVAEPTGHVVGMFELIPNGSGFIAKNRWNLMASRDMWSAPVQVKVGPDGAVWVSDFYSLVAQHNPDVRGMTATCCRAGPGAAYDTPNRDSIHGRIYRISYEKAPRYTPVRLDNATPTQLVNALKNDNMFWRMTAQQRLVERKQTDVVPALIGLLNDHTVDALGLNPGALHALWTLDGLGALKSNATALQSARKALSHSVRITAPRSIAGVAARCPAGRRHFRRWPAARSDLSWPSRLHGGQQRAAGCRRTGAADGIARAVRTAAFGTRGSIDPRLDGRAAECARPVASRRGGDRRRETGAAVPAGFPASARASGHGSTGWDTQRGCHDDPLSRHPGRCQCNRCRVDRAAAGQRGHRQRGSGRDCAAPAAAGPWWWRWQPAGAAAGARGPAAHTDRRAEGRNHGRRARRAGRAGRGLRTSRAALGYA